MLLNLGTALVMKLEDDFRAGQKIVIVVESKYFVPQLKALIQQFKGFVDGSGLSALDQIINSVRLLEVRLDFVDILQMVP